MTRRVLAAGALALAAAAVAWAAASPARAQPRPSEAPPRITSDGDRTLLLDLSRRLPEARRTLRPLDPASLERLRRAQAMRAQGLLQGARDSLTRLLADVPHHPLVLTELARTRLALQEWTAVERLAVAERLAQKDSLLLAQELVEAEERLGRPTDAARVAIEAWAASPEMADWASQTLDRLTPADPRVTREAMHRAIARQGGRTDLARGLARLEWRAGDARAMVQALAAADHGGRSPLRWTFAEELARTGVMRDTLGAFETLLDLASDRAVQAGYRTAAAQRAWDLARPQGVVRDAATRLVHALADVPRSRWDGALLVSLARALREAGLTAEARSLIDSPGEDGAARPALQLERALADLRDGPPERVLPALREAASAPGASEAAYRYAEALFYAGQSDSARAWYDRLSKDPSGPYAGAALERLFLIEEASPPSALASFGRIAYAEWRGDLKRAGALADSLYRTLPRGAMWAEAAMILSAQLERSGNATAALEPLLAVADSLPGDRLAPRARQRAGDLYLHRLGDEAHAIDQYEQCLESYPRAWNAPEVRRTLEQLRHQKRP
jgi:tetratricopeptide (TPR) repeat protein